MIAFGVEKCAYLNIERGIRESLCETIAMNDLQLQEPEEGDCYQYLSQDEDIEYKATLNKQRVTRKE